MERAHTRQMCRERTGRQPVLSRQRRLCSEGVVHRVVSQTSEQGQLLGKHYAVPVNKVIITWKYSAMLTGNVEGYLRILDDVMCDAI